MSASELQNSLIKGIYEASPDGILVVDDKGVIVSHNHRFAEICRIPSDRMYGFESGTVIGLDAAPVLSTVLERVKDTQAFLARVKQLYDNPHLNDFCEIELLDGRTVERHSTVLNSNDGRYLGRVWFFRDITERKRIEQDLRLTHAAIQNSKNAFFWVNPQGKVTYGNDYACQSLGYTGEELIGLHVWDFDPDFLPEMQDPFWADIKQNGMYVLETRHRHRDGTIFPVEVVANYIASDGEERVFCSVQDITKRKQAEEALSKSKAQLRILVETIPDLVWLKDEQGVYLRCNQMFERFFGAKEADILGKTDYDFVNKELADFFRMKDLAAIAAGKPSVNEEEVIFADNGHHAMLETIKTPLYAADGKLIGVLGIARDITERKQAEEEIRNLAFYDTLTKLPNRRLLNDRLIHAIAASTRSGLYGALMFLDMDNFKPLNDMYGHDVGDLLLVEVTRRITICVREVDTVSRFGGDEFVVVLNELNVDKAESATQASNVAEKIRAALAEPYELKIRPEGKAEITVEHHCTSSIGMVLFINHEATAEDILKRADIAMYQAKGAGRNQIWFIDAKV